MRFISYRTDSGEGVGVRCDDGYHGLAVADLGADLRQAIGQGAEAASALGVRLAQAPRLDSGAFTLLPPIPRPDKVFCVGLNYRTHAEETGQPIPDYPVIFSRFHSSLVAHGAPLVRPHASDKFDYEAELAVVIGRPGRRIPRRDALKHVAGYAPFNDGSIRDFQFKSSQWTMGKNFDGTGCFGPELVTPDELPDGAAGLRIQARLNGETLQDADTGDLIFDVPALIEIVSEAVTLAPGDVIVTGTPGGVGAARQPRIWLKPGDVCEIAIEGLGILSNPVRAEG